MNKKGISPVIATVLLISIVVVISLVVFLWFRGINQEAITKFDGTNVKLICSNVLFEATYSEDSIFISNIGNVPIYQIKAKVGSSGEFSTITLGQDGSWPELGLNQGEVYSGYLDASSGDTITLIPVLLGSSDRGDQSYTCDEKDGYEFELD